MKKTIFYLFSVFIGVFVFTGNGWSFRCGVDLISMGDTRIKTSMTCGNPTSKEQKCLEWHRETGICINKGETWYYNCGEGDFIYVLTFNEGGALISETTAGRGTGSSDCQGKPARQEIK